MQTLVHTTHPRRRTCVCAVPVITLALATVIACHPPVRSTLPAPPTGAELSELWVDPGARRDLFDGVGGKALAPDPMARYKVIDIKTSGFSEGYDVVDPSNREWSAKFAPEAQPEVVASRILWAVGYHQPPIYFLDGWTAEGAKTPNPQGPARFREKAPNLKGLKEDGGWSYYQNPFVGTPQLQGLLVLHLMLANSDLKDSNNTIYTLDEPYLGARRWYVARDIGHAFGRTGVLNAPRNDPDVFVETPFIYAVHEGRVIFENRGRHGDLYQNISVEDVRWICERLNRLTEAQWDAAFKAGGYTQPIAGIYIGRMREKIEQGLSLVDGKQQP